MPEGFRREPGHLSSPDVGIEPSEEAIAKKKLKKQKVGHFGYFESYRKPLIICNPVSDH